MWPILNKSNPNITLESEHKHDLNIIVNLTYILP